MDNEIYRCTNALPWTDEQGKFDKFLCKKDFEECNCDCLQHKTSLNEWIISEFDRINNHLINGGD